MENTTGKKAFRGSPPQVRGKLIDEETGEITDRITPAGAGKTRNLIAARNNEPDHPRRCGENGAGKSHLCTAVGSPPQVRGKHLRSNLSS